MACFGQSAEYPQALSDHHLAEVLDIAESSGWQVALHDYLRPLDSAAYRAAVDEYRAQWRCLVPCHPSARVLDLRCGFGPIAISLAPDYGLVVAVDTRYELARFTAIRAAAAGARNLHAMTVNPRQPLPFVDAFFDVVLLHEVLEWSQPEALLREVARVTAPGGQLFLSASNRLGLARLLTVSGLSSAAAVTLRRPGLHTLAGYRRALAKAGFAPSDSFAILPEPSQPFYLVPLTGSRALRFFLDNLLESSALRIALSRRGLLAPYRVARALWRMARVLPVDFMARHFVPGYGVLAQRSSAPA